MKIYTSEECSLHKDSLNGSGIWMCSDKVSHVGEFGFYQINIIKGRKKKHFSF